MPHLPDSTFVVNITLLLPWLSDATWRSGLAPVHVEGHVAELVQDQQPRLGHVGGQPVQRALALVFRQAFLSHQRHLLLSHGVTEPEPPDLPAA